MKKRIVYIILSLALTTAMISGCTAQEISEGLKSSADTGRVDADKSDDGADGESAGGKDDEKASDKDGALEVKKSSDTEDTDMDDEDMEVTYLSYSSGDASTTGGLQIRSAGSYSNKAMEQEIDESDIDTHIKLIGSTADIDGEGAEVSGSTVTITEGGVYEITGTLDDGQIVVDAEDDKNVRIILNGASITTSEPSALKVVNAKNIYVNLAESSENKLTSTAADTSADADSGKTDVNAELDGDNDDDTDDDAGDSAEGDAVIYSKVDIIINGYGSLEITGNNDGIKSKDDVQITGGNISISAGDDGIVGKDSVEINSEGKLGITAGDEGISSTKDDDDEKGYIIIDNADITIDCGDHGIKAVRYIVINDGTINITKSYEGIEALNIIQNGGDVTITSDDDSVNVTDKTAESTAKKSGNDGGKKSADDSAELSDDMPQMRGGRQRDFGDGERPDMSNGGLQDGQRPEMPEGDMPDFAQNGMMRGGRGDLGQGGFKQGDFSQDDFDQVDFGQGRMDFGGGGTFENIDGAFVMNGGTLTINNGGDGIDSNGDIIVNGGTINIVGPGSPSNTAFDMNGELEINGGDITTYDGSEDGENRMGGFGGGRMQRQ